MMKTKMLNKKTINQTIRFGFVGVLNTIVGYGIYYIMVKLNIYYMISLLVSHIIGVTHSYFWNKYFTFKTKKKSGKELLRFISVYIVTFLLNLGLLTFFVEILNVGKEEAGFFALILVTLISFIGHKFWSFKDN